MSPAELPEARERARRKLARMRQVTEGWRPLISDPMVAQPGSSLARDDEANPEHPCSHIAWTGLGAAIDALDHFFVSLFEDRVHNTGHRVLARTAVTGAATAGWVLTGSRSQRQSNALRTAADDLAMERRALLQLRGDVDADEVVERSGLTWDETISKLDRRHERLVARAAARGVTEKQLKGRPALGEIVNYAVAHLPESHEENLAAAYSFTFAQLSAAVHTLRWAALLGMAETRDAGGGEALVRIETQLSDLEMMATAGMLLTSSALTTFRNRAVPP